MTGAMTAIDSYPGYRYVLPVLLGLITAVGGGILRDVLAQKVPVVLYEDVYAMASVVGGIVICVLYPITGIIYASWGGFGAVLLLRICAIISAGGFIVPQGYMAAKADRGNRSRQSIKITW